MLKLEKIKGRQIWLNSVVGKFWIRSNCRKSQCGFVDVSRCLQCPHFLGVKVGDRKIYVFCEKMSPNLPKNMKDRLVKVKNIQKLKSLYDNVKFKLLKRRG